MRTLFIALPLDIDRDEFCKFLETLQGHGQWFYSLPHTVFVNTSRSSYEIFQEIEKKYGAINVVVLPINYHESWGRIPKAHWNLIIK